MIVLTIMAFVAAIVLPMLGGGVSTSELKSAAREVAAGLRYARGQAIVQRGEAFLVLDVDARTFTLPPDPRVHRLPDKMDIKLFTAQRDLVGRKGRRDPLLSRWRIERRAHHAGRGRAQVRRRRRLAHRARAILE